MTKGKSSRLKKPTEILFLLFHYSILLFSPSQPSSLLPVLSRYLIALQASLSPNDSRHLHDNKSTLDRTCSERSSFHFFSSVSIDSSFSFTSSSSSPSSTCKIGHSFTLRDCHPNSDEFTLVC